MRLFEEIHEIVYHGNGGYDWDTVYRMPIWLRKFTYNQIKNYLTKKNEAEKGESPDNTAIGSDGVVKNKQIFKSKMPQAKFNPNPGGAKRSPTYK